MNSGDFIRVAGASFLVTMLSACGGKDGGDDQMTKTGQLIDSAVAGVTYQTASYSGKTNANGEYHFIEGEDVTFRIGGITFGPMAAKAVLTPLDLAGSSDIEDRKVINITRFLQTLDEDQNPENGIVIPSSANPAALNFDQEPSEFETHVSDLLDGLILVNQADAMAHLQDELDALGNSGSENPDSEPASVPAGFVGSHEFKYEAINPGSGIADGTVSTFEIMSGNKLKLPDGTVLVNPVFLNGNLAEVIWLDADSGLSYALSNAQTATLNELNVSYGLFGSSGFQFYGQYSPFVESTGDVPDALAAMDGAYTSRVYYSKAGNRNGWAVDDELTLTINGTTGVIDVGGVYSIDPADPSFSWTDKTGTNPMFNPHYEVLYSGIDKLLIYQRPGEPINGWRLTQEASASDGVNVAADVTPFIDTHQAYFDALDEQLPTTLVLVEQDGSNLFKEPLCTGYQFSFEAAGGTAGKPRLLYNKVSDSWIQSKEYSASSAAYAENGSAKSLYWAGFTLAVDGSLLTITGIQAGSEVGVVLTNDPAVIADTCPE